MRNAYLLLLLFLLHSESAWSHKEGKFLIDSLETALLSGRLSEAQQASVMTKLCFEYRNILPKSGIAYGERAEKLAKKINDNRLLGEIYIYLASCYGFY